MGIKGTEINELKKCTYKFKWRDITGRLKKTIGRALKESEGEKAL